MFLKSRLILFAAVTLILTSCKLTSDESVTETTSQSPSTEAPVVDFDVVADNGTPPPSNDDQTTLPPPDLNPDDTEFEEGFMINNGAAFTNLNSVNLTFQTLAPSKIKVGYSLNCTDGSWEPYVPEKHVQLTTLNQPVTFSMRFQDWEGATSSCYRRTIIHDNTGPEIIFQNYPTPTVEVGNSAEIAFMVRDPIENGVTVSCSLNDIQKSCFYGNNKVTLPELPLGNYIFTVTAKDHLQNTTTQSIQWTVHSLYKKIIQKITVNNYKKVDVLFVIDNSGSMAYEQKSMAQRTSQFLSILQGLDYQIAVTTTDPRNINLGDGRLVPLTGGNGTQKIIDASMNVTTAQSLLSRTLQRTEVGSGDEQGIRAVYRAIERYNQNQNDMRSFLRDDAQLSIVLISDEDESDNTVKNDPTHLLNLVSSTWGGQKRFNFNSIITRPNDAACHNFEGYSYGYRYNTLSTMTGGVIGDVCAMDYTEQVKGIADEIRRLLKTLTLTCQPLSQFAITIKKDGAVANHSYTIEGLNVKFATELDPGSYEVEYTCLK